MPNTITTKDYAGLKAVSESKGKKIGKVRNAVFHPSERRCIGFTVKRPDAALMFHRKDLFVRLDGFHVEDGQMVVHDGDPKATDRGAVKDLGVNWDACVIWVGMPVMTKSGEFMGYVSSVEFDRSSGAVLRVLAETGAAKDALLGKRAIPGEYVKGFRLGQGESVVPVGQAGGEEEDDRLKGAIMVSDKVLDLPVEGGAAAAAGKATAVASRKVKKTVVKTRKAVDEQVDKARPTAKRVAKKTGEAVEAGSFAVGKQLGKASGMFSAFKEEFDKAMNSEDE